MLLDPLFEAFARSKFRKFGVTLNGKNPWDPKVLDPSLYRRVLFGVPSLVIGEAYMNGQWTCDAIDELVARVTRVRKQSLLQQFVHAMYARLVARRAIQTKERSKNVIQYHYDRGDPLYDTMFAADPYRQYSCAYGFVEYGITSLSDAQKRKLRLICEKLQLDRPGLRVLDIGGGWGGLSKFMAEECGADVVMITLSEDQARGARAMCRDVKRGSVEVRVQDYRDVHEQFDRIVSIGMLEHVGPAFYEVYFDRITECLREDGIALVHSIYGRGVPDPWIDKYIFPDGILPRKDQIEAAIRNRLIAWDWHEFGRNYDPTLRAWCAGFDAGWESIKHLYDETFRRMWRYYLLMCAGTFRSQRIWVWQVVLAKQPRPAAYKPIR